jgi:hypothetical protein
VIPDEAVEAAFAQLPPGAGVYVNRDDLRVILQAAAPHIASRAWDEGYVIGRGDEYSTHVPAMGLAKTPNPYRSQE